MQRRIAAPMPRSPQPAGGEHDAEFEDPIQLDWGDFRTIAGDDLTLVEHPVDAIDQTLQRRAVELVGAAEIMHDLRFGPLGGSVPCVLGQSIIRDR